MKSGEAARRAQFTEYAAGKQQWLRRVAYLLCQDWHAADDLVQTTLTKLYVNWHRVQSSANPDGYARTILVNTFLAERRLLRVRRTVYSVDIPASEPAAKEGADLEGTLDLRRALPHLPAKQRATVVLRYYCELSVEETAQVLGCSQGTVKSQTSRALGTLRHLLGTQAADGRIPHAPHSEGMSTDGLRNTAARTAH